MTSRLLSRLALCGGLLISCGSNSAPATTSPGPLGPLAVTDESGDAGSDASLGVGTLRITESCVTFDVGNDETMTVVFPIGRVSWDETGGQIDYRTVDEGRVQLRDGDRLELAGTSDSDLAASVGWIQRPRTECPAKLAYVHDADTID
jgi:hypothetical protein